MESCWTTRRWTQNMDSFFPSSLAVWHAQRRRWSYSYNRSRPPNWLCATQEANPVTDPRGFLSTQRQQVVLFSPLGPVAFYLLRSRADQTSGLLAGELTANERLACGALRCRLQLLKRAAECIWGRTVTLLGQTTSQLDS